MTTTMKTMENEKMQHEQWMKLHNMCPALDDYITINKTWVLANGDVRHAETIYDVFCGATHHNEYGNVILVSVEYIDTCGMYHHEIGKILDVNAMAELLEKSKTPEINTETVETMDKNAVGEWMAELYENGFSGYNKLLDTLNDMVENGKITKTAYNTISKKLYDVEKSDIDAVMYCAKHDDSGKMSPENYIVNTWGMWSNVQLIVDDVVLTTECRNWDNDVYAINEKIHNCMVKNGINPENVVVIDVDMYLTTLWGVQSIMMTLVCTDSHKTKKNHNITENDENKLHETFEHIAELIDMDIITHGTGMHMMDIAIDDILSDYPTYDRLFCVCDDNWLCYRDFNYMVTSTMAKYPENTKLYKLVYDKINVIGNTVFINVYFIMVDENGKHVELELG